MLAMLFTVLLGVDAGYARCVTEGTAFSATPNQFVYGPPQGVTFR
ncbi:MAG: hypothetical protein WDN31_01470 [Hyphomicrobium sp.]